MYHFCTYFDQHYLPRGLALYRSLTRHAEPFKLYVLCFDDATYTFLSKLNRPNLIPIARERFEHGDVALLAAKKNRSLIEYYFTCTPSLPLYILNNFPNVDIVTYIDADLFFFASPAPIYAELGKQSILMIGHRFPEQQRHLEKFGAYNVGYLSFRNNRQGRACLEWWRQRCLEWCYDRLENGKFADQKYLDEWPTRFDEVVVLQHKGAGIAPWNVSNYTLDDNKGTVQIDSEPLIFYHFHAVKVIKPFWFDLDAVQAIFRRSKTLKQKVYAPYLRELQSLIRQTSFDGVLNIRHQTIPMTWENLGKTLIYHRTSFIFGPITQEVHLEPMLYSFLRVRRFLKDKLRQQQVQEV